MRIPKQNLLTALNIELALEIFSILTSGLFVGVLTLGFPNQAAAAETPYARTCRISGGEAWVVNYASGNDVMLCRFGSAAIGAAEFAELKWNDTQKASVRAFLSATPTEGGDETCRLNHASYAETKDSEQVQWALCTFGDGSVIEVNTLARGSADRHNAGLAAALGLR